jgi:predicted MarR family transcription regulator
MAPKKTTPPKRIVSSSHLADNPFGALSELEFSLTMVVNAYQRWMVRCMAAAGRTTMASGPELGALDVLVLHHVYHLERPKRLTDLALVLNIEDHHTINYGLKKLARLGLIRGERKGKEVSYAATERGRKLCDTYRQVREECLIESFDRLEVLDPDLSKTASLLRGLSGIYDQAARAATSR